KEPEQLVDDRLDVQLLGGEERKARREIETRLPPEHRARTRASAVRPVGAVFEDIAEQVEMLAHPSLLARFELDRSGVHSSPGWLGLVMSQASDRVLRCATDSGYWSSTSIPTRCTLTQLTARQ